jgi:O-antigen ligase
MMAIVGSVASVILLAVFSGWLKNNSSKHYQFWLVLGISTFMYSVVDQFGFELIGEATYPGFSKGVEITILDVAVVSYLIMTRGSQTKHAVPFKWVMILYFLAVLATVPGANLKGPVIYYAFQLLRMYALYRAVSMAMTDEKNYDGFLKGLCIGAVMEAGFVVFQRFVQGDIQPDGTFGHQNQLGLITNVVLLIMVASLLAGDRPTNRWIGAGASLLVSAVTGSRGVVGFAFMGLALSYFLSLFQGFTGRKAKLGVLGAVAAAILVPVAMIQLQQRFDRQGSLGIDSEDVYDERAAYNAAAAEMLSDYPLGVGANNFVIVANVNGYYERAEVAPTANSRSGHVHNVYWLTMAELGYFGIVSLLLLMAVPIIQGIAVAIRHKGKPEAQMALGLVCTLFVTYMHGNFEWVLVTTNSQYFVAIVLGLLASRMALLEGSPVIAPAAAPGRPELRPAGPRPMAAPGVAKPRF